MKLAVAGKGGVGKTSLVALLAREAAARSYRVLAVDGDPDSNLATTLGFPNPVAPLAEEDALVAERVGGGGFIKLNPTVDDIPDRYAVERDGIRLLVLGGIRGGGMGCACPANTLLKALIVHLMLQEDDAVIVDMEAGIEHLGRGTVQGVDALLLVVESDVRSLETVERTSSLAREIGIKRILAVANKVRDPEELAEIERLLPSGVPIAGVIPYIDALRITARHGPLPADQRFPAIKKLFSRLEHDLTTDRS